MIIKNILSSFFIITLLCQNINHAGTLRCAHSCSIGPIALGSPDPIKPPCNTVDINSNTTSCSVFLTINFETSYVHGTLYEKPRPENKLSTLSISSTVWSSKTLTFINYYCATSDDCDQDFVRETISSANWSRINETKLRSDLDVLLFRINASDQNIICDNDLICTSTQHCYGELIQNNSNSHNHHVDYNNKYPCDNASSSQITIEQSYSAPDQRDTTIIKIYCNRDGCNQRKIGEQVFNVVRNNFNLPLNYSAYLPKPNQSQRMQYHVGIIVFLIFTIINLT